jgi:hypothetical protein
MQYPNPDLYGPELLPAGPPPALALKVEDVYLREEPVTIHARLDPARPESGALSVEIAPIGPKAAVAPALHTMHALDDGWTLEVPPLPPGLYSVVAQTAMQGPGDPSPVHSLFAVVDPAER